MTNHHPCIRQLESLHVSDGRTEMDHHSETCVVCDNLLVIDYLNQSVSVNSYDANLPSFSKRIVNTALAYDDPEMGKTSVFKVN